MTRDLAKEKGTRSTLHPRVPPWFRLHSGVLDSGCGVHIADGIDFLVCDQTYGRRHVWTEFPLCWWQGHPGQWRGPPAVCSRWHQRRGAGRLLYLPGREGVKSRRPVSMICSAGVDVMFMTAGALVRDPEGGHVVYTYPRSGGLYNGGMRLRRPLHPSLGRQGQ